MEEKTHFAPARRSTNQEVLEKHDLIASLKQFNEIYGAISGITAIIDKNRQVVFSNDDFLKLLGLESVEPVLGKRPGEIVSCIHSDEEPFGCGTAQACTYCGAVNAIMESQLSGKKSTKECRISAGGEGKLLSWDLNVTSTPIVLAGETFYVLTIQDISNEKRKSALERIFFHDILNSAGGLSGLLTILKEGTDPEEAKDIINLSEEASRDLLEEITLHRQIRAAEAGDLQVKIEPVDSREFLVSTVGKIGSHEVGKNKQVIIDSETDSVRFETDRMLLQRVIINLLKNALEATSQNGSVSTGVDSKDGKIKFRVKNDGVMPEEVKAQIFQRSYSTKGQNRGIGTYSIKLLTENYLKGKVSFISNEKDGTVFYVELGTIWPPA
ncbi:MAG: HAMP domain-containing sensor histidine kinase [Bacteroidota bacterium]